MDVNPIERFDRLLRDLLAWNLVEQDDAGAWGLPSVVVQRLTYLSDLTRRDVPSEVVYFGHVCSGCGSNGLTRLREERYLCDGCRRAAELAAVATPLPQPDGEPSRRWPVHPGGLAS